MAQAPSYSIDRQAAINGSSSGYQRITTSGEYTGRFTKVKYTVAGTGATGLDFSFESDTGAEARYITLWTFNKHGERTHAADQVSALMTCLKVRETNPQPATIKEWNFEVSAEVDKQVQLYPALMNKRIGLILQREQYRKADGSTGERMNLAGFFDAETRRSAREVMTDTPAADTDAVLANLHDKLIKKPAPAGSTAATSRPQAQTPPMTNGAAVALGTHTSDAFDDSIPF